MRLLFLLALATSDFSQSFAQQVPVEDASQTGSPLSISGTLVFADDGTQTTPYALKVNASAKNKSRREVILFRVSLEIFSNGVPSGPHEYVNDCYFSSTLIEPQNAVQIPFSFPRYGPRALSNAPLLRAKAVVEFVQFEDGTIWGDTDGIKEALNVRALTLRELKVLRDKYQEGGDKAFSERIMNPPRILPTIAFLQQTYRKDGVKAAETKT